MTQISTEALAAAAKAGVTVTEYRGYQLIDNNDYVAICRNAAIVQCAHTPAQARQNIDEIIDAAERGFGAPITTYRGYDLREGANRKGVAAYAGGVLIFEDKNLALAKSQIDFILAPKAQPKPAQPSPTMTDAERAARAKRMLNRYENNPNDLI